MRLQDREVRDECQDERKLSERQSHLKPRRRSLAQEVGGQGVLFHRKEQGLWTNRVHRLVDKTIAIVSKSARLVSQLGIPRGRTVVVLESAQAEERTTRPQLSKGAPATEMSNGDKCLGQEDGAQGVLVWPEHIRGCEQTIDSPLRYGSE